MNKSVHTVLLPLLISNYVFGLKIVQLSTGHLRPWFGLIYILLLWLIYYCLRAHIIITYFDSNVYVIFIGLPDLTVQLSVLFGMYHNKKFKNCLKKLAIVDTTLENLGIITNYRPLRKQIIWTVLGWFVIAISANNMHIIFIKKVMDFNAMTAIYVSYVMNHCFHINLLEDLTIMSIIGYVGLKFDQINEQLRNMAYNNKYGMTQTWDNTVLNVRQRQFAKNSSNKWTIWTIIQLHLELRKISRELDSIFGVQMTFKMGYYFICLTIDLNNVYNVIFNRSYTNCIVLYSILVILWFSHNIMKLLIINLVCEKVSNQANSTKNFLYKISQAMNDVETCENISQLLLHIKQSPLRFYGIGLFQFGYKFIYVFVSSIGTVVVILIQTYTQSKILFKDI
ncbi:uncharacterized protein [Linepithema humile]|uniref:uncharacterized protein n=1 Tax=Linepithema humile TaxID=83485 RepID=UPI00351EBF9B